MISFENARNYTCMLCGKNEACGSHTISSSSLKYFLKNRQKNCLYMPSDPLFYMDRIIKGYPTQTKYARMTVRTGNASVAPIFCTQCDGTFRLSDIFAHSFLHKPEEQLMFQQLFIKAIGYQFHYLQSKINYWSCPNNQYISSVIKQHSDIEISHNKKLQQYRKDMKSFMNFNVVKYHNGTPIINLESIHEKKLDIIYETLNADFTGLAFVDKSIIWEKSMNKITRQFLHKMPDFFVVGLLFNRDGIPFFCGHNIPLESKQLFKDHFEEIITDFLKNLVPQNTYYGEREEESEKHFSIYKQLIDYTLTVA